MNTGLFSPIHNTYFGSTKGAFTTMTAPEVKKGTYNVKSIIKRMVIDKLGRETVKSFSPSNIPTFIGCDRLSDFNGKRLSLSFRYSKPAPKEEMTLYFSANKGIPANKLILGNIWFIYFKENDPSMWFGIMSPTEWKNIGNISNDYYYDDAELEEKQRLLNYSFDIDDLLVTLVNAPQLPKATVSRNKGKKTISCKDLQNQIDNRKIKGTKGEEIVVKVEKDKLIASGRKDLADKVKWVSKETDGLGYDIESFEIMPDNTVKDIFIEVKTTSQDITTPFNVSLNEVEISEEKTDAYYIYRVFNLDEKGQDIKYYRIEGSIKENFELIPVSFKAIVK